MLRIDLWDGDESRPLSELRTEPQRFVTSTRGSSGVQSMVLYPTRVSAFRRSPMVGITVGSSCASRLLRGHHTPAMWWGRDAGLRSSTRPGTGRPIGTGGRRSMPRNWAGVALSPLTDDPYRCDPGGARTVVARGCRPSSRQNGFRS